MDEGPVERVLDPCGERVIILRCGLLAIERMASTVANTGVSIVPGPAVTARGSNPN